MVLTGTEPTKIHHPNREEGGDGCQCNSPRDVQCFHTGENHTRAQEKGEDSDLCCSIGAVTIRMTALHKLAATILL